MISHNSCNQAAPSRYILKPADSYVATCISSGRRIETFSQSNATALLESGLYHVTPIMQYLVELNEELGK